MLELFKAESINLRFPRLSDVRENVQYIEDIKNLIDRDQDIKI